jgi:hypothetical protein
MFAAVSIQNEFSRQTSIARRLLIYCYGLCKTLAGMKFGSKGAVSRFVLLKTLKDYEKLTK